MDGIAAVRGRVLLGLVVALIVLAGCSRGEKREFLGPPDDTPLDNSIAAVVVTPELGSIQLDEVIQLAAFGRNNQGDSIGLAVQWSASGGEVNGDGLFTAHRPGSYWVVARSEQRAEKADSARVVVIGPDNPIEGVLVTPKNLAIRSGQSRQFTATVRLQDGTTGSMPVFWSASGGTIDANGWYTPDGEPGQYLVLAIAAPGIVDTAQVTVASFPVLTSLALSSSEDTVSVGGTKQYAVDVAWSDGSDSLPDIDYSATGGTIDGSGLFNAGTLYGDFFVTARHRGSGKTDTARVRIRDDRFTDIIVNPGTVTLAPGAAAAFSAVGQTNDGGVVPVDVNWEATGGSITGRGKYTAGTTPGTFRVIGRLKGGDQADTATVEIAAPSASLTQLVLNPSTVTLASGASRLFTVSASWSDGKTTVPTLTWTAGGGTITGDGEYTAGTTPGTYRVIAKHAGGTLADTSTVTIAGAILVDLEIAPAGATVDKGGQQQFTARGIMSDGSTSSPTLTWAATGGTITSGGLFTAGQTTGTYRVIARGPGGTPADTAFVSVQSAAPVLQEITVSPASASVTAGKSRQFSASGTWTNGGTGAPAVTWSATGGTISSGGLYTAGQTAGTYRVIAKEQGGTLADTAVVSVTPPAPVLIGISVTPGTASLQPGGTKQFSADGIWTNGGSGAPTVVWSATGGTVSASGLYQAGSSAGTFRVIARQWGGTLADTAFVTISQAAPVLTAIEVTPDSATVAVGGTQQYAVAGVWTNGGSGAPSVSWSATGGAVSSSGVYTAGNTAGTYRVIATQQNGTLADTVTVLVSQAPVSVVEVAVEPGSPTVSTGATVQFRGWVKLSNGTWVQPTTMSWAATGGTISSGGLFTAGSGGGTYEVRASTSGVADTVPVTVVGPTIESLTLTPATVSLTAGATKQFSVSALWSDGVSRPVAASFSATGGTISVGGLYTAGALAGTFRVIAAASGVADTSVVTIGSATAPSATVTSIEVTPSSAALSPGGSRQFSVTAHWSDGTQSVPSVTWSASGGTVSSSGLYTAPSGTGTYQVIARQNAGTLADTATVTVSSGGSGTQGAWVVEDFGTYASTAELLSDPKGIYTPHEDVNPGRISLDKTTAPPGDVASMKFTFPDRTNDSRLCHDYTIGRNIKLPQGVQEIWAEIWVRFSPGFEVAVPGGVCNGISGVQYKWIFGRTGSGRFGLLLGYQGGPNYSTLEYPGGQGGAVRWDLVPSSVADGVWRPVRFHMRVGGNGSGLVAAELAGVRKVQSVSTTATTITGIALGRNMNQGPTQVQTLHWGRIRVWRSDPGWGW